MSIECIWIPRKLKDGIWEPFKTIPPPPGKNWETSYLKYNDQFPDVIKCQLYCNNLNILNTVNNEDYSIK